MGGARYLDRLESLKDAISFTSKEARHLSVPSHALDYLCRTGRLERLGRGIYRFSDSPSDADLKWEELLVTARSVRGGVVCLVSALYYYDLTEQLPWEHWLAVPNESWAPKRERTRIMRLRNMELGQTRVRIGCCELSIFDRERTIVDAFRFLDIEVAVRALRAYLGDEAHRPNYQKLRNYARLLRVNIDAYVLALTA